MDLTSAASASSRFHCFQDARSRSFALTCSRGTPTFTQREFITVRGSREENAKITSDKPRRTKNMDLNFLIDLYLFPTEHPDSYSVNAHSPEHQIPDLRAAVGDMCTFKSHIPHGLIEMRQG